MKTTKQRGRIHLIVFVIGCILMLAAGSIQRAQQRQRQAVDSNGAPLFKVDPFWPKPLPNRWGMQQVTGIFVDQNDHIWFLLPKAKRKLDRRTSNKLSISRKCRLRSKGALASSCLTHRKDSMAR